jgi:uncharacterized protein YjbI with pentapeptide repeats
MAKRVHQAKHSQTPNPRVDAEPPLDLLRSNVGLWNEWKASNLFTRVNLPGIRLADLDLRAVDLNNAFLTEAVLDGSDLSGAQLAGADLHRATLRSCKLVSANLQHADLFGTLFQDCTMTKAYLRESTLIKADLHSAVLTGANLELAHATGAIFDGAMLREANFRGTHLQGASFQHVKAFRANFAWSNLYQANFAGSDLQEVSFDCSILIGADLTHSDLTGASVYGTSAWNVGLEGATEKSLRITEKDSPLVQVDSLEVAQFIYLLLNNKKIRHVIDKITSKVVLILGRFTPERKAILDAIRDELRHRDYVPVLFDFEKPSSRDITETVSTLAHMARFVIADITDAKSIPQELMAIVPALPSVPVQPLLLASQHEYGMFEHFKRYPWVLEPYLYEDQDRLLAALTEKVIGPAEAKAKEQSGR